MAMGHISYRYPDNCGSRVYENHKDISNSVNMPSLIHHITFLAFSIRSKSPFNCVNRACAFLSNPVCRAILTACENSIDHSLLVGLPWFSRRCISPLMGFVFFLASALCRASRRCSLFYCACELWSIVVT